ncbi:MAG: outer membrane receptor protein involved in Fe transport [Patiriisocius sp.]|jgi:outer membrane receptor protein involved in Fe transport
MAFLRYIITFLIFFIALGAWSQEGRGPGKRGQSLTIKGEIFGQVLDSLTNQPMEYVTVSLMDANSGSVVTGIITTAKGKYSLTNVGAGIYKIRYDFVGYSSKTVGPVAISKEKLTAPLKVVRLHSSIALDEVVIASGKPEVSFDIDKKIINVADQETESGQTAVEVMQTIPSVSVDIDGNVSLRGNESFTLLIDGKPTAMDVSDALLSIPASTIENIEIITNASAKYEAEGVSGIVNIITKKKKLEGTSMLSNVSYGNFDNYSGDVAVNVNKDKFSYNFNAGYSHRNRPRLVNSERISANDSVQTLVKSSGEDRRNGGRQNVSGEISYSPNSGNTISIGGLIGNMSHNNSGEIGFIETQNGVVTRDYFNDESAIREFNIYNANLTYRHNINRNSKHYLEFKSILRARSGDEEVITQYIDQGILTGANRYTESGPTDMVRFNLDYSKEINADNTFETGGQMQIGESGDVGKNYTLDVDLDEYILNQDLSSDVNYTRDITAAYALYRGKLSKLGYQFGIRAEQTERDISSDNFEDFVKIDRLDYFPSAHLSYELPHDQQVMVSYSRRINRPRSWYFEPFLTWQSAYQLRTGNPDLQPEYINALELNWNKSLSKKGSISIETYFRNVEDVINRINEVYEDNILLRKPFNVGNSTSFGIEPAINLNVKKWWKLNLGFNFYDYTIKGTLNDVNFDQHSFNWSARMSNNFKLGKDWKFQLSPQYNSATVTPQGTASDNFTTNAALSKSIQNGKFTFGLQARDVFSTSRNESEFNVGSVFIYSIREPRTPFISLNIALKLNNYKRKMGGGGNEDSF